MVPTFKNYTVVREIGSGGMSVVYEAIDNKLKRFVALKVLYPHLCGDAEASARFRREALAAARMDHPHIVRVYDYLSEEDTQAIAMEYVPGTDMESVQKKRGTVDPGPAVAVMGEIARAMAEAHGLGIIHRDIKPANILIHRQGRAMLTDFGLAHHRLDSRLTQGDAVAGTPVFMSPEQISGKNLSPATDVYSWAVTLYFLLAGKLPYAFQEFPDIIPDIQQAKVVFHGEVLKALPACWCELMRRCLAPFPAERIGGGEELTSAVERCLRTHPLAGDIFLLSADEKRVEPPGPEGPRLSKTSLFFPASSRASGKKRLLYVAAVFAVLCAASAALYFILKKSAPDAAAISFSAISPTPADSSASFPEPSRTALAGPTPRPVRKTATPRKAAIEGRRAEADSGQLFVYCSPWATVFIDGRESGTTPFEKPISLPAGIHTIRLYNKYCVPREDTVTVTANAILRKRYSLPRLE